MKTELGALVSAGAVTANRLAEAVGTAFGVAAGPMIFPVGCAVVVAKSVWAERKVSHVARPYAQFAFVAVELLGIEELLVPV